MDLLHQIWSDYIIHILDILITGFIIYRLILLFKGTRAMQVLLGIIILAVSTLIIYAFGFRALGWLVEKFWLAGIVILVVVFQPELRAALAHLGSGPMSKIIIPEEYSFIKDIVDAALTAQIDIADSEERKKTLESRRFFAVNVFDAPVVVVALTRPWPNSRPQEQPVFNQGLQSVAAAIAQLHLAATALGYGGCWATLPIEMAREEIEAILGVEEPWFAVSMLSIGVPAKTPRDIPRKLIKEIVTFK